MTELILKSYLTINISLAVSYGVFLLAEALFTSTTSQMSFKTRLRTGQFLLLLSLFAPMMVKLLPTRTVNGVSASILMPLSEAGDALKLHFPKSVSQVNTTAAAQTSITAQEKLDLLKLTATLLLMGILVSLILRVVSGFRVWRLLESGIVIKSVGRVTITASSFFHVPFSTSLGGSAWIAVPESMIGNWGDFKLAVRHEAQHHRQNDGIWAVLIDVIVPIFFLNPFIYFWKRRISEIQEFSCDEALMGRKISSYDYGSCLVRVAEAALENCEVLVGTASMAAGFENPNYFKSFLRRRIEMLVQHNHRRPCRWAGFIVGTLAMASTLAFAFGAEQVVAGKTESKITAGLVTTDPEIQKIADNALDAALKRHKASLGFVVVSDPQTGRILAVANKDLMEVQAEHTPHWALSLRVGPASLAKAIVAAAAVDKGVTSVDEVHSCEMGRYTLGGKLFQDWKPFDKLTTAEAVIQSSNICGIKVGQKLGAQGVSQAFRDFGFGPGGSAENFPEARAGELQEPTSGDNTLYIATLSTGYGGAYLSPLEMVQAFGAIANGGNLLKPQNGKTIPVIVRRVISEETSKKMKEVLAGVLTHGTAKESGSSLYRLAGKTATGYSHTHVGHDTLGGDSNMASFVGFGPVENPRVVIYVGVENPTDKHGVHGAYHAAPVFREVAEKTLAYLGVPKK